MQRVVLAEVSLLRLAWRSLLFTNPTLKTAVLVLVLVVGWHVSNATMWTVYVDAHRSFFLFSLSCSFSEATRLWILDNLDWKKFLAVLSLVPPSC